MAEWVYEMQIINPMAKLPFHQQIGKYRERLYYPNDLADYSPPRALKIEEIPQIINDFSLAARNAIKAGD
jgi:2,4-dienoyl-CoA reductase-like NADH-dependent reductase (Old Yellow Enzyme family)